MSASLHVERASRVEVIDSNGRVFVEYYEAGEGVTVVTQDGGQTVKVFAGKPRGAA